MMPAGASVEACRQVSVFSSSLARLLDRIIDETLMYRGR
jgi:hypothetical protein